MDEKQLRRHLIRLYTITVALTLAVVFAVITLLSVRETRQKDREQFFVLFTAIAERLQTGPSLSHSQLREYERQNGMLFSITDSGALLSYNGDDSPERGRLLGVAEELARGEGLDINMLPLTSQRRTSSVFSFSFDGRSYFAAASVIPTVSSYRTLIAAQEISDEWSWSYALYVAAYLLSVFVLYLVGIRLIDRALRPAVESRTRQTEFIAAASHELRSPLAVIQANADTVAELPEHSREAARTITAECERMSRLISDMLLLASTDAKNWPVTLAPVELDTLLIDVYEAYAPVCRRRGFRLALSLPDEPMPTVEGDAQRLSQVLGILIDNAMNYGEDAENKEIALSVQPRKGRLCVRVTDHGAGIPDEQKPHIFERFYRGDSSRKTKQHFGLGLAIAKELVTLNNGSIAVADTAGGGSTFSIVL